MSFDSAPNSEAITKETLLSESVEGGWQLFAHQIGQVKGEEGNSIQREIDRNVPFLQRLTGANWEAKISLAAKKVRDEDPSLQNETEARIAVMTENARYYRIAKALGEEASLPAGYVKTMEALRASMPWNKTGSNPITLRELTIKDLEESVSYIRSKLTTR